MANSLRHAQLARGYAAPLMVPGVSDSATVPEHQLYIILIPLQIVACLPQKKNEQQCSLSFPLISMVCFLRLGVVRIIFGTESNRPANSLKAINRSTILCCRHSPAWAGTITQERVWLFLFLLNLADFTGAFVKPSCKPKFPKVASLAPRIIFGYKNFN